MSADDTSRGKDVSNQTPTRNLGGCQRPGEAWTPLLAVGAGASAVGRDGYPWVCTKM